MSRINWPSWAERTPTHQRERNTNFSASVATTSDDLRTDMQRLNPDDWRVETGSGGSHTDAKGLPRHTAAPDDPGVVLRWSKDGDDHAVACDEYSRLRDNLRTVYHWVHETRLRATRPVTTGQDEFAAAKLPSGDDTDAVVAREPPHEVLGVAPDASDDAVRAAYRELVTDAHPDQGGSVEKMKRLQQARDALVSE